MFKVVPDQLRVSEGWVRCGQCSEVFDANANLVDPTATGPAPPRVINEPEHSRETTASASSSVDINTSDELTTSDTDSNVNDGIEPSTDPFLAVNPHALYIDPLEDGAAVPEPVLQPEAGAEQESIRSAVAVDAVDESALRHSFLQPQTEPPPPRPRRVVRVVLAVVATLLVLALCLQVAVHERDRLVTVEPATRMALEPLCDLLGCKIAPLRNIESVVIDSSSFTKVRADVYRLGFTLKNTSQVALATPALELTLTDLQDQTVVRKVFAATDFGDVRGVLQPGAELQTSLPVAVKLNGNAEKISGYRLLSFYP